MNRAEGVMTERAGAVVDRARTARTAGTKPRATVEKGERGSGSRAGLAQGVQERIEASALGRAMISFGVMFTLAAILVACLPDSVIKSSLLVRAQPYLTAVGLGEDWGVFAPSPRTAVIYGSGDIQYSDGTSSVWSFPVRSGVMAYSDYRWQKFEEYVRLDDHRGLWQPFAQYLADHQATPGRTPVQVSLMRRWADIHPPGVTPGLGPWSQYVYYVMPLQEAK
jgi:hypothetical protein